MDAYTEAHLVVSAVRILLHRHGGPPELGEVCGMLEFSDEAGYAICRNLKEHGILDIIEDPFSVKLVVGDYLNIEKLPRVAESENSIASEVEKFQAEKAKSQKKMEDLKAEIARKQDQKMADIEAKFKKEMEKFKKS